MRILTLIVAKYFDRLPHHSQVPTIRGESYRLREKRRSGLYLGAKALQEPGT